MNVSWQKPEYNGLKDAHLDGFLYSKNVRKVLVHNGLVILFICVEICSNFSDRLTSKGK